MDNHNVILVGTGLAVVLLACLLHWRRTMRKRREGYWELVIPTHLRDSLRSDPRFHAVMKLSRIANTIRFTQVALTQHRMADTPTAKRQRFSSFFYASAIVFEGLKLTQTLGKDFGNLPEYKNGFGRIHADPKVRRLRETILDRARNEMVFHLDEEVPKEGLATLNVDKWVVASGSGPQIQDSYFDLADVLLIHYLIGSPDSNQDFLAAYKQALVDITALLLDFVSSAESLIARVLKDLGATLEYPVPPPKGSSEP
jgi:hypothetical protein